MDELTRVLHDMDKTYDEDRIYADEQRDLEENEEWYESMKYVEKPEYLIKKHAAEEAARQGISIKDKLKPLKDMVIIAMKKPEENKSGIIIARTNKQPEANEGTVVALNENTTDYGFNVGDKVVFDPHHIRHRYNNNGIHIIINKDFILGVFCD